ncbi:hypothetical protein COLO4_15860 [Corchorus olitorius]|uniref:Uncharacterized protein n=1 Tax=Corchorus olitorius TaxID=93759 RepID=A0A1R3JKT9_9ROSI|nr:hypothetical protein COLO4_15860 [Corchorus olitorius]
MEGGSKGNKEEGGAALDEDELPDGFDMLEEDPIR